MFELSQHLEAAGLVNDELFDALAALKPGRADEVYASGQPTSVPRYPKKRVRRKSTVLLGLGGLIGLAGLVYFVVVYSNLAMEVETPTHHECEKHADHYADLMRKGKEGPQLEIARSVASDMRSEIIRECQEERSKQEIDCMLRADSMEVLEGCLGKAR